MKENNYLRVIASGCAAVALCWAIAANSAAQAQDLKPTGSSDATDEVNDPLEPLNRGVFWVNQWLEAWFIRPLSIFYRSFLPPGMQRSVGNVLYNLAEPVNFANELLQGEGTLAGKTAGRFLVNSTYGVGGMFDQATDLGLPRHSEDFGQTLAVWGVGEGFYLVLPLFGPSNPRDGVGKYVVDSFIEPWGYVLDTTVMRSKMVIDGVNEYSGVADDLDQIKKTSVDYYAALRSLYRQKRATEIRNGESPDLPAIPDLKSDLDEGPAAGPRPAAGKSESQDQALAR